MKVNVSKLEIEQFFLRAMAESWANNAVAKKIVEMPGYKALSFSEGGFYLLDSYCADERDVRSDGTTTIWFHNRPIWIMQYGGFHQREVISFLKSALMKSYKYYQSFCGGRGPYYYKEGDLLYINRPISNDFGNFAGQEEIIDIGKSEQAEYPKRLGYYEYHGKLYD